MKIKKLDNKPSSRLRTLALVSLIVGAAASLGFMFHAGRHNNSIILLLLFTGWVLSPYIGLAMAMSLSRRWAPPACIPLFFLVFFLATASLVVYSGLLSPKGIKNAFVFLAFPLISWVLMAIVISMAKSRSRRLLEVKSAD